MPEKSQKVPKNASKWLKCAQKCRKVSKRRDFIVLVLLSAHTERVGVTGMQDFYLGATNNTFVTQGEIKSYFGKQIL